MSKEKVNYLGRWDIKSMGMWPEDYLHCNEAAYFRIAADGTGDFVFGAVSAGVDGCYSKETERFEYSFQGSNDRDLICGRGWFKFKDTESSNGEIFIHMGDTSTIHLSR